MEIIGAFVLFVIIYGIGKLASKEPAKPVYPTTRVQRWYVWKLINRK